MASSTPEAAEIEREFADSQEDWCEAILRLRKSLRCAELLNDSDVEHATTLRQHSAILLQLIDRGFMDNDGIETATEEMIAAGVVPVGWTIYDVEQPDYAGRCKVRGLTPKPITPELEASGERVQVWLKNGWGKWGWHYACYVDQKGLEPGWYNESTDECEVSPIRETPTHYLPAPDDLEAG